MVRLHFIWFQGGEEFPGVNSMLRPNLCVIDSHCGCCRLIGSFFGVTCKFPLSSTLLAEFLVGWRCSNGILGCFPFGNAPFDDFLQVLQHLCVHLYRALYSCFPFISRWRILLVSAMISMIRSRFAFSLIDAKVHAAKRARAGNIPRTRSMTAPVWGCSMVFSNYNFRVSVRFDQIYGNSGGSTLDMVRVTTTITITIVFRNHIKLLICPDLQPGCRLDHTCCTKQKKAVKSLYTTYCGNFVYKLSDFR
jgi:hypothetical protein